MTPRTIWLAIAAVWMVVIGITIYRNRSTIKTWGKDSKGWVSNKGRSAYGRVASVADRVMHTERSSEAS